MTAERKTRTIHGAHDTVVFGRLCVHVCIQMPPCKRKLRGSCVGYIDSNGIFAGKDKVFNMKVAVTKTA